MTKTHIWKFLLTFCLVFALFTAGVSASAEYEIDTKNLLGEEGRYFISAGTDLILPVNLTCTDENELISRIEVTAIVENTGTPVSDVIYTYTTDVEAMYAGQKVSTPNVFGMTGMGDEETLDGINSASPVFELNISGLTAGNTYTVKLNIVSGSGNPDSVISEESITVAVKNWLVSEGETFDNTKPEYAANDKWSFTQNATVREIVITLPNPATAGVYTSDILFPKISGTENPDTYAYALVLNDTKFINVEKSTDAQNWVTSSITITENSDKTIQAVIGEEDAGTTYLKITFTGKKLGDVVDTDNHVSGDVNLADIDNLLQEIVNGLDGTFIEKSRYIYGDICKSSEKDTGCLSANDAMLLFQHWCLN